MMSLFEIRRIPHVLISLLALASVALLQGCFHKNDSTPAYSIGGTVSGLTGTVVLQNNSGDDLTITSDGDFSFDTSLVSGSSYAVTVFTNPSGQGCTISNGSGSVSGATVSDVVVTCVNDANPTGYYDQGTLFVNSDTTTDEGAFQAIIHNNRLMMVSIKEWLMYDGTMTIAGNEFTTDAVVYEAGVKTGTTTITGTITEGVEITLGVLKGTGVMGNGTFTLTYASAETNGNTAEILKVVSDMDNPEWTGAISGSEPDYQFQIPGLYSLTDDVEATGGGLDTCTIAGEISLIPSTALYGILIDPVDSCENLAINGTSFTGLAVTKTVANETLLMLFSDGNYAGYGEHQ